jgi:SAM-dependent methyltransferase
LKKNGRNIVKKYFYYLFEKLTTFYINCPEDSFEYGKSFRIPKGGLFYGLKIKYGSLSDCKIPSESNNIFNENNDPILVPISAVAKSFDNTKIIKIEFVEDVRKINSLVNEVEIIKKLNALECQSAPLLLDSSNLKLAFLKNILSEVDYRTLSLLGVKVVEYMITEYIPYERKVSLADLLLAMLEQKSLGFYQGDLKPQNIRFDSRRGLCVLIDYDQAERIDETVRDMSASEFLSWCNYRDAEKYSLNSKNWMRRFGYILPKLSCFFLLKNGVFDLSKTSIYRGQATTNTAGGVYHTIKSKVIFAEGVRTLKERALLLDKVEFESNERVLDVGCNAGLLCHYLFKRGCLPWGVELDAPIVQAAKIISNILNIKSKFSVLDLDKDDLPAKFDTVCLFSVIHHTNNLEENCLKIAKSCRRILIECRLREKGKKPLKDIVGKLSWVDTTMWDYKNEESLFLGLSKLFPKFKVVRKIGKSDKGRIMIEMVKK